VLDVVRVVKDPVDAVVAPTVIPLIVPPVRVAPLEESVFSVAVEDAPRVVKDPAAGVTLPMIPCKDVAVATPSVGVTRVGLVAKTKAPEPVSSVTAAARLADDGVARNVATPVPSPLTPVAMGKSVALVKVADDGVPRAGVTKVGDVLNTRLVEVVPVAPDAV